MSWYPVARVPECPQRSVRAPLPSQHRRHPSRVSDSSRRATVPPRSCAPYLRGVPRARGGGKGARAERSERERCWSDRVTRRANKANLHDTAAICQERGAIVSPECPQSKGAPARSEASANGVGALATQSHTVTLSGYQDIMSGYQDIMSGYQDILSGYQDNTHRHAGLGFGPLEMGPLETHLHVDLRQSRA